MTGSPWPSCPLLGMAAAAFGGLIVKDSLLQQQTQTHPPPLPCLELHFLLGTWTLPWGMEWGPAVAQRPWGARLFCLEDACLLQDGVFTCEAAVCDQWALGFYWGARSWIEGTHCCVPTWSLVSVHRYRPSCAGPHAGQVCSHPCPWLLAHGRRPTHKQCQASSHLS